MRGIKRVLRLWRPIAWRTVWLTALLLAPVLAVVVMGGQRRWMHDDGFINLRIVRNLLQGAGPVFNVDERVEAGTSPLWLGVLTLLGALGFRLEHAAVFAGIALTGAGLVAAQLGSLSSGPAGADRWPRVGALPIGAAIVAALPPVWDYASSGLETGLGIAWLGLCYAALARRIEHGSSGAPHARRDMVMAMSFGLGPLIRPEFILYGGVFFVTLLAASAVESSRYGRRAVVTVVASAAASACALPLAYQLFRMAFYGCVAPNTAIAKEAFSTNWPQGRCYFGNFFDTYAMGWPLGAASLFWVARVHAHFTSRRWSELSLAVSLPIAASVHVAYLVAIGGDYMHARLLIPALVAALLPVMAVPVSGWTSPVARLALASSGVAIAAWVAVCAARLRIGAENVCGIGDEHGWYVSQAGTDNPVALESYRSHPFYDGARRALERARSACPGAQSPSATARCRRVYVDDEESSLAPAPGSPSIAPVIDGRIEAVLSSGAIGIFGYLLPSTMHLVDRHGLADPVTARIELHDRGRPGHEKKLSPAWTLARFTEPAAEEDAAITAARHALNCGPLAVLERSVSAPLTMKVVFDNFAHVLSNSRLRVPPDPFDAEAKFCGVPAGRDVSVGGSGGTPFRWQCPSGRSLSGLRAAYKEQDAALSLVRPLCRRAGNLGATLEGPTFGESSTGVFDVECPDGSALTGLRVHSDNLIRSIGVVCSLGAAPVRAVGIDRGSELTLSCPPDTVVRGVAGRSGALVDSLGLSCGRSSAATSYVRYGPPGFPENQSASK